MRVTIARSAGVARVAVVARIRLTAPCVEDYHPAAACPRTPRAPSCPPRPTPRRRAARVTRRVVERRPGMGDQAILPNTTEPPLGPLDRARVRSAESDFVIEAFEEHQQKLTSFAYAHDARPGRCRRSRPGVLPAARQGAPGRPAARQRERLAVPRVQQPGDEPRPPHHDASRSSSASRAEGTDSPPADIEILRREENTALLEGLAQLPADARAALLMAAQGFSGREIAEALGRTEVATRTMMFRAREKLRIYLVREGVRG